MASILANLDLIMNGLKDWISGVKVEKSGKKAIILRNGYLHDINILSIRQVTHNKLLQLDTINRETTNVRGSGSIYIGEKREAVDPLDYDDLIHLQIEYVSPLGFYKKKEIIV